MKVKLLKKVRNKYQIRQNSNGTKALFEKCLFWYVKYEPYFSTLCKITVHERLFGEPKDIYEYLAIVLNIEYGKYTRRYKESKRKKNTWTKVWYNG